MFRWHFESLEQTKQKGWGFTQLQMMMDVPQYMGHSNGWIYWRLSIPYWAVKGYIILCEFVLDAPAELLLSIWTSCNVFKNKIGSLIKPDVAPSKVCKTSPEGRWHHHVAVHLRCGSPCIGQQAQRAGPSPNNVGLGWVKAAHGLQLPQLYVSYWDPPSLAQPCECNEYRAFMYVAGNRIVHIVKCKECSECTKCKIKWCR